MTVAGKGQYAVRALPDTTGLVPLARGRACRRLRGRRYLRRRFGLDGEFRRRERHARDHVAQNDRGARARIVGHHPLPNCVGLAENTIWILPYSGCWGPAQGDYGGVSDFSV